MPVVELRRYGCCRWGLGLGLGGCCGGFSLDFVCRWQVQVSVYCFKWIPAHLRLTQCSFLLHLIDSWFLQCGRYRKFTLVSVWLSDAWPTCPYNGKLGPIGGCRLLFAFRDLWKEMGWLQFSDPYRTASSTTGGWNRWDILMCFIYIILSTTVSHFWTLRMPFFTRSPFFVYISIFASTLFMCVMYFTSIWRILLMTDGLNCDGSNDRAAPTDTNPKNLELAPPQSVTATRLVYSPTQFVQQFTKTAVTAPPLVSFGAIMGPSSSSSSCLQTSIFYFFCMLFSYIIELLKVIQCAEMWQETTS